MGESYYLSPHEKPPLDSSSSDTRTMALLKARPVSVLDVVKLTLAIGRLARGKDDAELLLEACGLISYKPNATAQYRWGQAS